jgi:hypothetical protein
VLVGSESVVIPPDFARTHQPAFDFPYSHGLLAGLIWAATFATACARLADMRWRGCVLIAAAVFSHWLLDALVHRAELPLGFRGSPSVGLGLWQHMAVALAVEAAVVASGLWLFMSGRSLSRARMLSLAALTLVVLVFTVAGMTVAPPPPSARAMAVSSLVVLAIVCALFCWLGRPPRVEPA